VSQTRRLAAILAADVAGYSRLIGADEGGTLERLKTLRRELVDPKIAEHRGRLVKTTGDGLLVEFGSVVDALRCAVEVQREMVGRDAGAPPACYAHMGRLDEARGIVARLHAIIPKVIPDCFLDNPEHRELFLSGLRMATSET
jgi:hypothetical protein